MKTIKINYLAIYSKIILIQLLSLDSKFHSKANEKEIALNDLHNNYKTFKEEQNQFRKYHQLSREPNFATVGNTIKHLGLILVLF